MDVDTSDTKSYVADCNTKESAKSRRRNWFLTLNNPIDDELDTIKQRLCTLCDKYAWQLEEGEEGTLHVQGVFCLRSAKTFDSMRKILERGHWEVCRNVKAAANYCSKFDTRVGETHIQGFKETKKLPIQNPREWQAKLINELKEDPDDRKVVWYFDKNGGSGKTTLCRHIVRMFPDDTIMVSGRANDVKCAIARMYEDGKEVKIVFFNIVRSLEKYVSYQAIEEIKDGIFFSGKYESGMVDIEPPHVVVFANFEPDYDALTKDRWDVRPLGL